MNNRELKTIVKLFEESKLSSMKLQRDDVTIELQKNTAPSPASQNASPSQSKEEAQPAAESAPEKPTTNYDPVKAPLVGTYYEAPAPDQPAFVREGQSVKKGDTLCIIEAMKVMNEITAPRDGRVVKIHAKNGDMVMYDQVVMEIE